MTMIYEERKMVDPSLMMDSNNLLCDEVLDMSDLCKTPEGKRQQHEQQQQQQGDYPEMPPTVKALQDETQIRDSRVLQNLLRNEEKYLPPCPDYMSSVQEGGVTPQMRQVVAEWMLEVVHEQRSQPEVFTLAMNIMDRFLCGCRVLKSQLQLLGSVCVMVASKMREPCPIPGQTLIVYTDNSITPEEIKEWELLVLYKLQWELTAVTPMDFLDHTLPRICLEDLTVDDMEELRRRIETILVLAATNYRFAYTTSSLMAATAIITAIESLGRYDAEAMRNIRLNLQTVIHTSNAQIDECSEDLRAILPAYLKEANQPLPSPDSTTLTMSPATPMSTVTPTKPSSLNEATPLANNSPEVDLACKEQLADDSALLLLDESNRSPESSGFCLSTTSDEGTTTVSRSSSPLSAVDIFTEFNTGVLRAVFEQGEQAMQEPGYSSILVS